MIALGFLYCSRVGPNISLVVAVESEISFLSTNGNKRVSMHMHGPVAVLLFDIEKKESTKHDFT